jgi:hypothetical protein
MLKMKSNMKYLRRFNEGLSSNEYDELKEFCENCLAYLLDDGFEVKFSDRLGNDENDSSFLVDSDYFWVDLYGSQDDESNWNLFRDSINYSWDEVKDYYIPFIKLINNKYKLVSKKIYFKIADVENEFHNFSIEEVINDRISFDEIVTISVEIGGKL